MTKKHYIHAKWHPQGVWLRLYNFAINRWDLHHEHKRWLDDLAIQFLNENSAHTFVVVGMASRTGPEAYNLVLSEKRAEEVFSYLKLNNVSGHLDSRFPDPIFAGGEEFAKTAGSPDNSEDPYYRAAEVWLLKNLLDYQEFRIGRQLPADHGLI